MSDEEEDLGPDPDAEGQPLRLPKKAAKVRNKAPASVQITAEQLIREAKERDLEVQAPVNQNIIMREKRFFSVLNLVKGRL